MTKVQGEPATRDLLNMEPSDELMRLGPLYKHGNHQRGLRCSPLQGRNVEWGKPGPLGVASPCWHFAMTAWLAVVASQDGLR
mmetsp:Transcript_130105/g.324369  ORF Transcript_130105/g.324369 Transcript_130105/m.324369 type:complete len:82 (-) Transcript_130105:1534-1779(-)